jgi:hypothetical protein
MILLEANTCTEHPLLIIRWKIDVSAFELLLLAASSWRRLATKLSWTKNQAWQRSWRTQLDVLFNSISVNSGFCRDGGVAGIASGRSTYGYNHCERQYVLKSWWLMLNWFQGIPTAGASIGPLYADQTIVEVSNSTGVYSLVLA